MPAFKAFSKDYIRFSWKKSGPSLKMNWYGFFAKGLYKLGFRGVAQLWKGVGYVNGVHGVKPKLLGTIHIIYFGNIVCKASLVFNS